MDRRELLKKIAILTGGVVIGGEVFLSGCTTGAKAGAFSPETIALLDEIGETIIPATATPGAKAAAVGEFMKVMITDCYTEAEQKVFTDGIEKLQEVCKKCMINPLWNVRRSNGMTCSCVTGKRSKAFNDKKNEAEKEQREIAKAAKQPFVGAPPHYYTMMKQLTLWGFFTSKTGMTETLRHLPGTWKV
jgi:hypothetical protein